MIRAFLHRRPWVWVVLLFVFFVVANVIMVLIAVSNSPERIGT